MILDRMDQNPGTRYLFIMAMTVIVVGGLRLGAPILLPFSFALFLAVLTLPIVIWLQKRGVPAYMDLDIAVKALGAAAAYSRFTERLSETAGV